MGGMGRWDACSLRHTEWLALRRASFAHTHAGPPATTVIATVRQVGYHPIMTIKVDLHMLQTDLPQLLDQVEAGDTVLVCKDQKPLAEIRAVQKKRPLGLAAGQVSILPGFDDPLPEELLGAFEGKAE